MTTDSGDIFHEDRVRPSSCSTRTSKRTNAAKITDEYLEVLLRAQ